MMPTNFPKYWLGNLYRVCSRVPHELQTLYEYLMYCQSKSSSCAH